ncbi:MAG TPA: N-6 DNA methylase [Tepidisphaeraceae bacterium]|nr:N-6 DNA methylase [Tepidisphaeraceae bacterium]
MSSSVAATRSRKSTGAYYTPRPLIDLLLDHALPGTPLEAPLRILDPACGPGDFLAAVNDRLAATQPDADYFGVDTDPAAVSLCRALQWAVGDRPWAIANSDALLAPPPFLAAGSFDLIVGNPPYVNAIKKYLARETKEQLRERFPNLTGATDLAAYFLALAIRLVRPGGRIAFVLPRALLNSPTATALRAGLPPHLRPNLIYAPERTDFFPGAKVFVCCLILGPADVSLLSTDSDPAMARFIESPVPATPNWWQHVHEHCPLPIADCRLNDAQTSTLSATGNGQSESRTVPLSSAFHARASLTAGDAYDLLPHLVDSVDGPGQKLLTTGLIDPRVSRWGRATCRYLKRDFGHPRVDPAAPLTASLARRTAESRRPKIVVAGLAKRFEAVLDAGGQYLGAVSTFSIFHPSDDVAALARLLDHLLAPAMTEHLIATLAANALRGRHITLKKRFLLDLPIPASVVADSPFTGCARFA